MGAYDHAPDASKMAILLEVHEEARDLAVSPTSLKPGTVPGPWSALIQHWTRCEVPRHPTRLPLLMNTFVDH